MTTDAFYDNLRLWAKENPVPPGRHMGLYEAWRARAKSLFDPTVEPHLLRLLGEGDWNEQYVALVLIRVVCHLDAFQVGNGDDVFFEVIRPDGEVLIVHADHI